MEKRAIILGAVFLLTLGVVAIGTECVLCADPNDYIDDPYELDNGQFECGDPNLTNYGFKPPIYWGRKPSPDTTLDCYAALHSSFDPNNPKANWSITGPLMPHEGETFVVLSTGGFDEISDGEIAGAKICQEVYLNEGDVILGAYFLGTIDYPRYNDYGRIFAQLHPDYIPDPNELVINGGFDSAEDWELTGLWTIGDPNILDPNIPDPNLPDPNIATYNVYLQQIIDPNIESTLSQTIPFVPYATYQVSIDVLTGEFDSGNGDFDVTLGNETLTMIVDANNTTIKQSFTPTSGDTLTIVWDNGGSINIDNVSVRYSGPPDPNELVINGGFDSDTDWDMTGLWTISDPNISDPNFPDPNFPDPNLPDPNLPDTNIATYNVLQQSPDPNEESTLSQFIPFVPYATYQVSIDVLTGVFNSGSDAFTVTLGDETYTMTADPNTTITKLFTPTAGDMLTISWDNEGTINIDNVSVRYFAPADEFVIAYKSLGTEPNDVPGYGSTKGWVAFEHIVEPNQAGPYILQCEVIDVEDEIVTTYLAVDGLRICRGEKPQSDLNDDCNVNLIDYSILSEAWLAFCPPGPPYDCNEIDCDTIATDPNILEICELADFDKSWYVDPNDLVIMSDEWLFNASEPNNI